MHQPQSTDIGLNRTGIALSPIDSGKLIEGADKAAPSSEANGTSVDTVRASYVQARIPVGTMPPPMTPQGVVSTAKNLIQGKKPTVILDKLGERMAYERTGVRLYELVIAKCWTLIPDRTQVIQLLQEILRDEMQHFETLKQAIVKLGGDPTAMTPCADVTGVASMGLVQAISDPRTTVAQTINTLLIVEAADNEGWDMLIELCEMMNEKGLRDSFEECRVREEEHLVTIRKMMSDLIAMEIKNQEV